MAAVIGRYARAYAEVMSDGDAKVVSEADSDQAVDELNEIAALVGGSSELRHIFLNPAVEHKQKLSLLDAIMERTGGLKFERRVHLRNFLAVLIDHKRIGQIQEIAALFKQEMEQRMGIAEASISSARELTDGEKESLERRLAAVTGKKLRPTYTQDASLLGGALVRVGSTIYDGSVRGQLDRLKEQIAGH